MATKLRTLTEARAASDVPIVQVTGHRFEVLADNRQAEPQILLELQTESGLAAFILDKGFILDAMTASEQKGRHIRQRYTKKKRKATK